MKFELIVLIVIHHSLAVLDESKVNFPETCKGYINGTNLSCNDTQSKLLFILT